MYFLKKTVTISAAHNLVSPYEGQCKKIHGHNWKITVYCRSHSLNDKGMIIDFVEIKKIVNQLDHSFINEIIKQPTAENMAKWIVDNISTCYRTDVEETEGSVASYEL